MMDVLGLPLGVGCVAAQRVQRACGWLGQAGSHGLRAAVGQRLGTAAPVRTVRTPWARLLDTPSKRLASQPLPAAAPARLTRAIGVCERQDEFPIQIGSS